MHSLKVGSAIDQEGGPMRGFYLPAIFLRCEYLFHLHPHKATRLTFCQQPPPSIDKLETRKTPGFKMAK
jgi:hypothetical protein